MIEQTEVLILTDKDKLIKGFVDILGNLTIGKTTYIADFDGKCRTIKGQNGEEIKIDIFVEDKGPKVLSKN